MFVRVCNFCYIVIVYIYIAYISFQLCVYWLIFLQSSTFQAVIASGDTRTFTIFTYQCGMLHLCCFRGPIPASIGFGAELDFFENHNLSMTENVDDIACLNEEYSEWSSVLYQISRGKHNSQNSQTYTYTSNSFITYRKISVKLNSLAELLIIGLCLS